MKVLVVLALATSVAFGFQGASLPVQSLHNSFRGDAIVENVPVHYSGNIVMDGKSNALRDRIKSVKNTKKITTAMRLVAAAKVRRAQDAVLQGRPFTENLQKVMSGLLAQIGTEDIDLPLLRTRAVDKVLLVGISGDRGLCGSYNNYAIKRTDARIAELKAAGIDYELVTIGKKISAYYRRREAPVAAVFDCTQAPDATMATEIAELLLASFLGEDADAVELVYTKFVSMISSNPSIRTMLPLSKTGIESEGDEIFELTSKDGDFSVDRVELGRPDPMTINPQVIFEQNPIQILNAILPLYLNGQILKCLQESVASELASRMAAMQAASDNAGALGKSLSQQYNRARQASVTQELLEIVAGASAAAEN